MNAETYYWIFLNHLPDLGPFRFHELLGETKSAQAIAELEPWRDAIQSDDLRGRVEKEIDRCERGEFRIITGLDNDYPEPLRELKDAPPVLYVKGRWPIGPSPRFGVVGTRRPSAYGAEAARRLTADLVALHVTTISGLALGIDRIAHEQTLLYGGHTVAVLGHGLGHRYPRENSGLYEQISEKGTLLTEFPFDIGPQGAHFPRRNRIISGLSQGVAVIEAKKRSGALITARFAAEQGKDVFAVPGSIFSSTSGGCHRLIKEGAKLVETVEDIVQEMGWSMPVLKSSTPTVAAGNDEHENLSSLEKLILQQLSKQVFTVDELAAALNVSFDRLAEALLSLELKGCVKQLPGQRYLAPIYG